MPVARQLSAVCVATAALTASVNANAHYYSYLYSSNVYGPADDGAAIITRADILHQTCNTFVQDFDTHEMWYMTDSSGNFWIEVGVYDGEGTDAIFNPCENDVIFWADSRPGGGLNVHFFNNGWSFGSYYQAEVTASGSCRWDVFFGGLALGSSTSNCPGSGRRLFAGIETTSQSSGSVRGFSTGWESQDGSGNWSWQGWGTIRCYEDNQPLIQQVGDSPWGAQTEETLNEGL